MEEGEIKVVGFEITKELHREIGNIVKVVIENKDNELFQRYMFTAQKILDALDDMTKSNLMDIGGGFVIGALIVAAHIGRMLDAAAECVSETERPGRDQCH